MKLSFDGIRMNLVQEFNELACTALSFQQRKLMRELRSTVGVLLAAYDKRDQPDDCNMLADRFTLIEIPNEEDEEQAGQA